MDNTKAKIEKARRRRNFWGNTESNIENMKNLINLLKNNFLFWIVQPPPPRNKWRSPQSMKVPPKNMENQVPHGSFWFIPPQKSGGGAYHGIRKKNT